MSSGKVDEPGPATKKVMTKSSSDSVTDTKKPAMMPGIDTGTITLSSASISSRAEVIGGLDDRMVEFVKPRRHDEQYVGHVKGHMRDKNGYQPSFILSAANKISNDTPIIISGKMSGRNEVI